MKKKGFHTYKGMTRKLTRVIERNKRNKQSKEESENERNYFLSSQLLLIGKRSVKHRRNINILL